MLGLILFDVMEAFFDHILTVDGLEHLPDVPEGTCECELLETVDDGRSYDIIEENKEIKINFKAKD